MGLKRSVNQAPVTIDTFGTVGAGTLRLLDVIASGKWSEYLMHVDYLFGWSGPDETWNESVEVQKYGFQVRRVKVHDTAGVAMTQTRDMIEAVKDPLSNPETRSLFRLKDFSFLQGLTTW